MGRKSKDKKVLFGSDALFARMNILPKGSSRSILANLHYNKAIQKGMFRQGDVYVDPLGKMKEKKREEAFARHYATDIEEPCKECGEIHKPKIKWKKDGSIG